MVWSLSMNIKIFAATAAVLLALPFAASAQGVVGRAAEGAREGNHAAGPVGAVVGGAAGAVGGGRNVSTKVRQPVSEFKL
jgi:hypothetical protein